MIRLCFIKKLLLFLTFMVIGKTFVSAQSKLKMGDCFLFKIPDIKKNIGFTLVGGQYDDLNDKLYLQFAIVLLPDKSNINIEDFKKGEFYFHMVKRRNNPNGDIVGVHTMDFNKDSYFLLKEFIYIGNVSLGKNKFIIGSGGNAPLPERTFNAYFKHLDFHKSSYQKQKLEVILQ